MKPRILAVAAGIPPEIGDDFVTGFIKTLPIAVWLPLGRTKCYTSSYSRNLYGRLVAKLKDRELSNGSDLYSRTNLVLLYLDKNDGSESTIYERFGAEALVTPIRQPDMGVVPLVTKNQRRRASNDLVREGRKAISHAQKLLSVVAEEVSNRDNRTCLLLPPRNFGGGVDPVFECVRMASLMREEAEKFRGRLRRVSQSLPTQREGHHKFFVGRRGLVFRSPGKAGARHAMAPDWRTPGNHDPSCVTRSLVRHQRTPAVRGILRPEISLRLRYSQRQGATLPELPRDHEHIAWSNPREHLTERQHPLKLMGRRHIASAHWFIVAEVSDGCACFPEIRKSHPVSTPLSQDS